MKQIKLEPTAALMIQWGKNAFSSDVINKYLEHLDLTAGKTLYDKCNEICSWYNQVVQNGKIFVNDYLNKKLASSVGEHLIIIPGAGKSPMALELLNKHWDKVNKVIEIDISGMDEKQELYSRLFPAMADKIKCITADITSKSILAVLKTMVHEYYDDIPCIILLEGVTYFLSKNDIEKIIESFISTGQKNILLIEYLKPLNKVHSDLRHIPEKIFSTIKDHSGAKQIFSFPSSYFSKTLLKKGGRLEMKKNLYDLEKNAYGSNKYFDNADKGWIEYEIWNI